MKGGFPWRVLLTTRILTCIASIVGICAFFMMGMWTIFTTDICITHTRVITTST